MHCSHCSVQLTCDVRHLEPADRPPPLAIHADDLAVLKVSIVRLDLSVSVHQCVSVSVCHLSSPAHLPDEDVGVVVLTPDGVGQLQPYNGRGYREEGAVAGHSTSRLYNTQTPP